MSKAPFFKSVALTVSALFFTVLASASDHVDGPVSKANAVADITDLFVFQTPGAERSLTFILDVYPFVASTGHFSDKVTYDFILRKASVSADHASFETDPHSEVVITCSFVTPNKNANIQITCQSNDPNHRIKGQVSFNQISQNLVGNDIQLFAGRRLDPFFLSQKFASAFMKYKKTTPDSVNILSHLNVLSIVMNIDKDLLFSVLQASAPGKTSALVTSATAKLGSRHVAQSEESMIAVAVQSMTSDAGVPRRIDRVGRPEISNISMNMNSKASGGEIRDTYNEDRPYAVPKEHFDSYVARLTRTIGGYDMIDGKQDWSPQQLSQLTTVLSNDFLLIDPSVACDHSQYLEIEKALLRGEPHQSCGGRDPNDNITNKIYTLYEHGLANREDVLPDSQDGLKGPSVPISKSFPYLAKPDDSIYAAIKREGAILLGP